MNDVPTQEQTATLAVRVYDHGELIETVLCDDEADAREVIDRWTESPGISCQVDGWTPEQDPDDVLEPELWTDESEE
jgi:hypothetical protein